MKAERVGQDASQVRVAHACPVTLDDEAHVAALLILTLCYCELGLKGNQSLTG